MNTPRPANAPSPENEVAPISPAAVNVPRTVVDADALKPTFAVDVNAPEANTITPPDR